MTKRFGFTLAEVLITLGIIGVVAAMTIPTLMNQTGQAEFRTGFKKMMSTLNQAVTMSVALEDLSFSGLTGTSPNTLADMVNARMNVISTAATATNAIDGFAFDYVMYFNDGMSLLFKTSSAKDCTEAAQCTAYVDVNGTKKPNTVSTFSPATSTDCEKLVVKDRFMVKLYDQQVLPGDDAARCIMYK